MIDSIRIIKIAELAYQAEFETKSRHSQKKIVKHTHIIERMKQIMIKKTIS